MSLEDKFEENKPLAPFTTLGVGGPARWFVEAASESEIVEASTWARAHQLALFVLGGGSNLLVADAGFDGVVVKAGLRGIEAEQATEDGSKVYTAAAGEDWDRFVERTVEDNSAGIECLAGIPGTVGGTPVQNVGAYGQEVSTTIERVRAFDLEAEDFVEFTREECGFAYRQSRFNSADRGRYIVTRVDYRLTVDGRPTVRYADLERALEQHAAERNGKQIEHQNGQQVKQPSLAEVARVVRRVRQAKGMLLVAGDPDCRSAGSFFKNPIVGEEQLRHVTEVSGKEPPRFPVGPDPGKSGQVKLPAAWLIEQAGFSKGYVLGAAGVSSRHTLALINRGGATAAEILALAGEMNAAVEARFGIHLEMEPVMVGF
jgi:UDP-N-acetylmuramate dehydrogenase